MQIKKYFIKAHRLLGTVMSFFFALWIFSGFVLIFHHYPRYKSKDLIKYQKILTQNNLPNDDVLKCLDTKIQSYSSLGKLKSLEFENKPLKDAYCSLSFSSGKKKLLDNSLTPCLKTRKEIDHSYCSRVAQLWGKDIAKIDTIYNLDIWTPYRGLKKDLPFYRLHLDSNDELQVYISSKNGRIITKHNQTERLGAYLGAIPHWIMFTWFFQNPEMFSWFFITLAILGSFMLLIGIYIGIEKMRVARKMKAHRLSPYKKKSYKLHHILGTVFGGFMLMWALSGMMYVISVPSWLVGKTDNRSSSILKNTTTLLLSNYIGKDLERLYQKHNKLVRVTLSSTLSIPIIKLHDTNNKEYVYRLNGNSFTPFYFNENEIKDALKKSYGDEVRYALEKINAYDGYFKFTPNNKDEFVWRATIETLGEPALYFNNQTGQISHISKGQRLRQWLFKKPHTLSFAWLKNRPWLWYTMISILLLGAFIVAVTGLIISVPYTKRLLNKLRKKK